MLINIMQWLAGIGNIYRYVHPLIKMTKDLLSFNFDLRLILMNFCYFFFSENLLLPHCDIETNPCPNKKYKFFTFFQWNVNSLIAHNMLKLSSIVAHNSIHKYHFICICETHLYSSVR